MGTPKRDPQALIAKQRVGAQQVSADLKWLESGVLSAKVRRYLALALESSYGTGARQAGSITHAATDSTATLPPLLVYRSAICLPAPDDSLDRVRREVPRFIEVSFFKAGAPSKTCIRTAEERLDVSCRRHTPRSHRSPAVTYANAHLLQIAGEYRSGVRF
jgi:hypothetical protein